MTPLTADESLAHAQQIDRWCDEFERAWVGGQTPRLEDFIERTPLADREELLRELVAIELYHRGRRGEEPSLIHYLQRFPSLDRHSLERSAAIVADTRKTIDTSAAELSRADDLSRTADQAPTIPDYEIQGELGRGAMGVVYRARQLSLQRTVAIKVIRQGGVAEVRRFQAEATAIARIQHPNIVQVFEIGEQGGQPFLTLEWIDGGTLAQKTAGVPQPPRESARLVETLARAIHQAHQVGIVHRDLKPANVLLTREGTPKIADFGLAKQLDAPHGATASGMLLGTPQYMAPEQAAGQGGLVGPATDVYALGMILYELLAGRPPFQAAALPELLRDICEQEPTAPRQIKRSIPGDLETICLKCLQKSPARRYSTAAELADDLSRFLRDQPIQARPMSSVARTWRWCRRYPWVASLSALLAGVLGVVTIGSLLAAQRFRQLSQVATENADVADQRSREIRLELARSRVNEARMLRRSRRVGQFTGAMAKITEARDIFRELESRGFAVSAEDWKALRDEAASALLVPDIKTTARWPRGDSQLPQIATDVRNRRYVRMNKNATSAVICRFGSDAPVGEIPAPAGASFTHGLFSADGRRLLLYTESDQRHHFWDTSGKPKHLRSEPATARWGVLSDDGQISAYGPDSGGARFTQVDDGAVVAETHVGKLLFGFPLHPEKPWAALAGEKNLLLVFDYRQQQTVWQRELASPIQNACWSQNGRTLIVSSTDDLQTFHGDTGMPRGPAIANFDAGGLFPIATSHMDLIASSDWSGSLRLFGIDTGRIELKSNVRFFDWPRTIGSAGEFTLANDRDVYLSLQVRSGRLREFADRASRYTAMSHSGELLAVYREPGGHAIYHIPSGELLVDFPFAFGDLPLGFTSDDQSLLLYGRSAIGEVPLSKPEGSRAHWQFSPDRQIIPLITNREIWGMDRTGHLIAAPLYGAGASLFHRSMTPAPHVRIVNTPPQEDVRLAELSPDGRWVVLGSHVYGKIALYSASDGGWVRDLWSEGGGARFSPDGRWLAIGAFTGGGSLLQVADWKPRMELPGASMAFSHDGKLLAVDAGESTVAFFNTDSLREIGRIEVSDQTRIQPKHFTPDGRGLVALAVDNRRLLYFDLAGIRGDLRELALDWSWETVPVTPRTPPAIPRFELLVP